MTVEKERIYMVLTKSYLDALKLLVAQGIYFDRQEAIRDALRIFFEAQGITPFYPQEAEG